jgi:hypothetical protein
LEKERVQASDQVVSLARLVTAGEKEGKAIGQFYGPVEVP